MKLRAAAVDATTDDGQRVGGPWALPLDADAIKEIRALENEYGRVEFKQSKDNKQ